MRIELHPIYEVQLELHSWVNIDLAERGYYEIRIVPKPSSDFTSVNFSLASSGQAAVAGESKSELLPASVSSGTAISSTMDVVYCDEIFPLSDRFALTCQMLPTTDFSKPALLTLDFEVWFMNRYTPPSHYCFRLESRRSVQVLLHPSSLQAVSRAIVFDYMAPSALLLTAYTSLISVLPRRRKPDPTAPNVISTKLRTYHLSVCSALLSTAASIDAFFRRFADVLKISVAQGTSPTDSMTELIERLEASEKPWSTLEAECVQLSSRLSQMFTQLVQLFSNNPKIFSYLYEEHSESRLRVLGEAFCFLDRAPSQLLAPEYSRYLELQAYIAGSKYLKRIPRSPLFCPDTDSPVENCPIIFEERFIPRSSSVTSPSAANPEIENKLLTPVLKRKQWIDKEVSLRRENSSKSLRLLKSRRKSVDSPGALLIRRSGTFHNSPGNRATMIVGNGSSIDGNSNEKTTPERPHSADNTSSPSCQTATPDSETSPSTVSSATYSSPHVEPNKDSLRIKALVDFVREREEVKRKLSSKKYEGLLYSEESSHAVRPPPLFLSLSSCYVRDVEHLVVFVHGLEGSSDDLTPYRNILRVLAPNARMGFLMSRTNQMETWADINCMARNLLTEIREHLDSECRAVKRVSFIAHSLGGVIVRAAVGIQDESAAWLHPLLHTFFTINTPHLGLMYLGKSANIGVHLVQWWKRSQSIYQLSLKDAVAFRDSFLYLLSANRAFGKFKNVLLLGTPSDVFVPSHSALLEACKASTKDTSAMGTAYREMTANIMTDIMQSPRSTRVIRYTSFHCIDTATSNKVIGRAAHIAAVEDECFIEKLFSISALQYFM